LTSGANRSGQRLELHGARALVTGGAGFIGSTLVDSLLRLGCTVVALDNFDPFYPGKEGNVRHNLSNPKFVLLRGSILDAEKLGAAMKGADVVFHLAGQAGVRYCIENPLKAEEVNAKGTLDVLQAVRRAKTVKKMVYASSSSIFGNPVKPMLSESHPQNPTSPYGVSKLAGEKYCLAYHQTYGTPVTCLRYFSVYGPRGRPDQVVYSFAKRVMNGQPPLIYGDGKASRDFTFVSDIVEGIVRVVDRVPQPNPTWNSNQPDPATSSAPYRLYNIGNSHPVELLRYIEVLEECLGRKATKTLLPLQPGDVPDTYADVDELIADVGYRPDTPVEVGVRRFADWFVDFYGYR